MKEFLNGFMDTIPQLVFALGCLIGVKILEILKKKSTKPKDEVKGE
jgi:hypothetical protein